MKFNKIVSFGDSWTVGEGFDYDLERKLESEEPKEIDFFGGNKKTSCF